jgi:iron complex outermembrane receptor protein
VRGPQSALFGRNTLGGLVNITSARPAVGKWTGSLSVPVGNYGAWAVRGGVSGAVVQDKMSVGFSFAQVSRDGFTVNDVTGHDIDDRDAFSPRRSGCGRRRPREARVIFGKRARTATTR